MNYKLSQYVTEIKKDNKKNQTILFNTLSSGIVVLTANEAKMLKKKPLNELDVLNYQSLIDEGFIVPEDRNEYKYLKYNEFLFQQNFYNNKYLSYVIAPTTSCNLRCKYCFENNQNSKVIMNNETITQIVKFILNDVQRFKIKRVSVVWFGGEPLLCFNQIIDLGFRLKQELEKNNVDFSTRIITNGILLTKDKTELLVKKCNLTTAQITLDGLEKEYCERKGASPENYKQVIKNIINSAQLIDINLRLNVDKLNVSDMQKLAEFLLVEHDLKDKIKIYFSQLRDYAGVDKSNKIYFNDDEYAKAKLEFDKFLRKININPRKKGIAAIPEYKPMYCALSHANNYAIGPEGELYKCEHYFGIKEKVVGDVWNGLYFNDDYFDHINGVRNKACESCPLYPVCQSACPETFKLIKFMDGKRCNRYQKLNNMLKRIILDNISIK